jgi:hypothetical protein
MLRDNPYILRDKDKVIAECTRGWQLEPAQKMTLLLCKLRNNNIFSKVPKDVVRHLLCQKAHAPDFNIATLLHHVAYGNPDAVLAILKVNPFLLLQSADVIDPAGNTILGVTPYECALGAGDDDMAAKIAECFENIKGGEAARASQKAGYQPAIDGMLARPAYNIRPLLEILKASNAADVTAALEKDFTHDSLLNDALRELRVYFAPREIHKGEIHFNYVDLLEAYKVLADEFDTLRNGNNYDKCNLFWRQVVGIIQRLLPACDRQAFAQGLYGIIEDHKPLKRSFDFGYGAGSFPVTAGELSCSGLGYDFAGGRTGRGRSPCMADARWVRSVVGELAVRHWKYYFEIKQQACKILCHEPGNQQRIRCGSE